MIRRQKCESTFECITMGTRWSKTVRRQQVGVRENTQPIQNNTPLKGKSTSQTCVSQDKQCDMIGHHETQVSVCGEANLQSHIVGCPKSDCHANFTPVKTFNINHLPAGYRNSALYKLIKATADLTVRVDVRMTSPQRPEFYPDSSVPYPFYNMRSDDVTLRLGSGEIRVRKFINGSGLNAAGKKFDAKGEKYMSQFVRSTRTCPCDRCQSSRDPSNVWWEILVWTAAHVVFDDAEARRTICRLFFDEHDSPVVNLDKVSVSLVDIKRDMCWLKYVTCDSLGRKLYKMAVKRRKLCRKVVNRYKNKSDATLTVIVSHPHGLHKHVSVGRLLDNYKFSEYNEHSDFTKLTYSTATCQGSSGAKVTCVGSINGHVHSGVLGYGPNYSSVGLYRNDNTVI